MSEFKKEERTGENNAEHINGLITEVLYRELYAELGRMSISHDNPYRYGMYSGAKKMLEIVQTYIPENKKGEQDT